MSTVRPTAVEIRDRWDARLPVSRRHLRTLFGKCAKTIDRWVQNGTIPPEDIPGMNGDKHGEWSYELFRTIPGVQERLGPNS